MKKLLSTLMLVILLVLAACSNQSDDTDIEDSADNNADTEKQTEAEDSGEDQAADEDDEADVEISEDDEASDQSDASKGENELASFKEHSYLEDEFDVDNFDANVKVDNSDKRVILFSENGREKYKSIMIKQKDRLKIIQLGEGGQIFNKVID